MVSKTCSSKANLASVNPRTSSKNKPAEEEPQVMSDSVKITQDDEIIIKNVTTMDKDSKKLNEHYQKTVNQQHFLSNPHLINPRTTEVEHIAKLQEVRVDDKAAPAGRIRNSGSKTSDRTGTSTKRTSNCCNINNCRCERPSSQTVQNQPGHLSPPSNRHHQYHWTFLPNRRRPHGTYHCGAGKTL